MRLPRLQSGLTLIEMTVSIAIAAIVLSGLQQLLSTGMTAMDAVGEQADRARQARFAMSRVVEAVAGSDRLLLPMADNPTTNYEENVRLQTVPASPPQGTSTLSTAVLAVTLSRKVDIDADGIPDADNDGDGRFDEDLPADTQNDGKAGVRDIDDDGNGTRDFWLSPAGDDDESNDLKQSEDPINSIDDDGDGSIDEDPAADNNGDGCPGLCGIDDDGDGLIDEAIQAGGAGSYDATADDDEDGYSDEDWYDLVVFYLQGRSLIQRRAVPWDENQDNILNGRDYVESTIADDVTLVRFERVPVASGHEQLVDITLTLGDSIDESITLNTTIRLGGWR